MQVAQAFEVRIFARLAVPLLTAALVLGCVSDRPSTCQQQSECSSGFCGNAGFCASECSNDRDCPCGSFCSPGCGICMRYDGAGPATCFAYTQGLGLAEILGVCRDQTSGGDSGGASGAATCNLTPVTPQMCVVQAAPILDAAPPSDEPAVAEADAAASEQDADPSLSSESEGTP